MKRTFAILAAMALAFVSCTAEDNKEDEKGPEAPKITGEWSGVRDLAEKDDVFMHYSIKEDGTFTMIMEAWAQKRSGTYTADDKSITFTVKSWEWLWDRENGYADVNDENGVASWEEYAAQRPEEASWTATYEIDADGNMTLDGGPFNMELIYFLNPDYTPKKHLW